MGDQAGNRNDVKRGKRKSPDHSIPGSISISGRRRKEVADFHIAVRHRPIRGALGGFRAGMGGKNHIGGHRQPIVGSCGGSWVEVSVHVIGQANSGPLSALRVVNSKKHLIMRIQNGSREAALANQVG